MRQVEVTTEMLEAGQTALMQAWDVFAYGVEPHDDRLLRAIYIGMELARLHQGSAQPQGKRLARSRHTAK